MKSDRHPFSTRIALLGAIALGLSGCATAGKFSCSAPEGVACMSTQQVYEMTNRSPTRPVPTVQRKSRAGNFASHQTGAVGDSLVLTAPAQVVAPGWGASNHQTTTGYASGALPDLGGAPRGAPESIARLPAQVLRIWMAPWTDEAGDLHMPGYVYSEIKARRWSVGGAVAPGESLSSQFDPNAWQPPANP